MLDPRIISTVKRYIDYGWNTALIQRLVRSRFNAPIRAVCIKNIHEGKNCTPRCMENCPMIGAELWFIPEFNE